MWQKGQYWNVPLSYEMVKEKTASNLLLLPKKQTE